MTFKPKLTNFGMVIASVLIILLIIEVLMRVSYPQIRGHSDLYQYDEKLGWKFTPGKSGRIVYFGEANHMVNINEIGFRDNHYSVSDTSKRIMVIGDSFVTNIAVGANEVFTSIMNDQLTEYAVLNCGVNGYGQVQQLLMMKERLPQLKPDLLILMIYVRNDFFDNDATGPGWLYPRPVATINEKDSLKLIATPSYAAKEKTPQKLYKRSHLYHFVRRRIKNIQLKYQIENNEAFRPPEFVICRNEPNTDGNRIYELMKLLLERIHVEAKKRDIPILFVSAPSIVQVNDDLWDYFEEKYSNKGYSFKRTLPNDWLRETSKLNGWHFVDLYPSLQEEFRAGKLVYNSNEQHWNARGNQVVAETLIDYIKRNFITSIEKDVLYQ